MGDLSFTFALEITKSLVRVLQMTFVFPSKFLIIIIESIIICLHMSSKPFIINNYHKFILSYCEIITDVKKDLLNGYFKLVTKFYSNFESNSIAQASLRSPSFHWSQCSILY